MSTCSHVYGCAQVNTVDTCSHDGYMVTCVRVWTLYTCVGMWVLVGSGYNGGVVVIGGRCWLGMGIRSVSMVSG